MVGGEDGEDEGAEHEKGAYILYIHTNRIDLRQEESGSRAFVSYIAFASEGVGLACIRVAKRHLAFFLETREFFFCK